MWGQCRQRVSLGPGRVTAQTLPLRWSPGLFPPVTLRLSSRLLHAYLRLGSEGMLSRKLSDARLVPGHLVQVGTATFLLVAGTAISGTPAATVLCLQSHDL